MVENVQSSRVFVELWATSKQHSASETLDAVQRCENNLHLMSLPLVSVCCQGFVTWWKSRWNFISSASSVVFCVRNLCYDKCIEQWLQFHLLWDNHKASAYMDSHRLMARSLSIVSETNNFAIPDSLEHPSHQTGKASGYQNDFLTHFLVLWTNWNKHEITWRKLPISTDNLSVRVWFSLWIFNKLMSVVYVSVLFLIMKCAITLSKRCKSTRRFTEKWYFSQWQN